MKLAFVLADQSRHAPLRQGEFLREEIDGKYCWVYQRRYFDDSNIDEFNSLSDKLLREPDYTILVRAFRFLLVVKKEAPKKATEEVAEVKTTPPADPTTKAPAEAKPPTAKPKVPRKTAAKSAGIRSSGTIPQA